VIGRRRAREALEPALRREGALSHQGEAGSVRAPVCTAVLNSWTDAEGPRAYHGGAVCHAQGTHGVGAEVEGVISPSTVTGRCCGVGGARIGAFRKRNSRSTSGSSRLSTTSASEAKRCWVRSLSSWSAKTPESNKSLNLTAIAACRQASRRRSDLARSCVKRDPESTAMICSQTLKNDTLTHPSLWADR